MLIIKAKTLAEAWEKSFIEFYHKGKVLEDPEILKDDVLILEISDPLNEDQFHHLFPMPRELMEEYNKYIVNGEDRGNVLFEHALYHERFFAYPLSKNNQVQAIIDKLRVDPFSKRAQASMWYPDIDQKEKKVPCLQILWCCIENGKLVAHTHMRANDGYKKLLMNLNIFVEVIKYIADELSVPVGRYIHFVDSFHIYQEDKDGIESVVQRLRK